MFSCPGQRGKQPLVDDPGSGMDRGQDRTARIVEKPEDVLADPPAMLTAVPRARRYLTVSGYLPSARPHTDYSPVTIGLYADRS
jgi:hypothetical protein